jgi:hypothetical protein
MVFHVTCPKNDVFELRALREIREKLGIGINSTLRLFFVSPQFSESYRTRAKEDFLDKDERVDEPLWNYMHDTVLLSKDEVAAMWANTHIYTASPKNDDWKASSLRWLNVNK